MATVRCQGFGWLAAFVTRVGLVHACDDPQLLAFRLWPLQREQLAAASHDGARLSVWAEGRRGGKSTAMILLGLWACLLRPELRRYLRGGERGYAVAISPNLRQSRRLIHDARTIVEASPLLADELAEATLDELSFRTGHVFAAFPCTSRGGRGWPIHTLLLDEAAWFVADEHESFQTAEQVWRALQPATAQFGADARIVVGSTPAGPEGFFPTLYRKVTAGEIPDAIAFHAATAQANPTITAEFLEQERTLDPEAFAAEYEAKFTGGGRVFLDPALISDAVVDRGEVPPTTAEVGHWITGLDPSFASDPFGVAVVGREATLRRPQRLVTAAVRGWRPERQKPKSLQEERAREDKVLAEVAEFCLGYGGSAVVDQFKAAGVTERLRRLGVAVRVMNMTAHTKTAIYQELRARLTASDLELYPEPQLLAELRRIRTRYGPGRAQVEIPRLGGSHGDLAQALALAVYEHRGQGYETGGEYDWLLRQLGPSGRLDDSLSYDMKF
jgi:hypothetical protein